VRSCFFLAHNLLQAIEEILLEDIGFQRTAGLTGHNAQGLSQINPAFHRFDLRGIG